VHIEGYSDRPVFDASVWIDDPLFWPAFLLHVGSARTAVTAFDVDRADLDSYLDRFEDPERWPVFPAPIGAGTLYLIVCNLPDDVGIDWVLDENAKTAVLQAGAQPTGPGLPWSVLPADPAHLLIALQAAGDDIGDVEALDRVREAVRVIGASNQITKLADDLLEHRYWIRH
jgi:hypothetical protein